jgi:hypothetical protein
MSTIASLKMHQRRTKKCLIIQGISTKGEFECLTCTLSFLTKISLCSHTIACNKKHLPETNSELKQKNDSLEARLLNMASIEAKYNLLLEDNKKLEAKYDSLVQQITIEALSKKNKIINNTTTNNNISVFDRTDEEIKNIYAENLTIDHIAGGVQAIAKLIVEKVIKDMTGKPMITITDKSRGNAKYKLSTGEVVTDNGLDKFTEKHRDLVIKRMYQVASNPEHFADFLDTESKTCFGYNEMIDDSDGVNLKKNIIKNI